jgi:hypothetical protein
MYCGIDIGIKNLAICIVDPKKWLSFLDEKNQDTGIIYWECINLLNNENEKCSGIFKTGKKKGHICNKKARKKTSSAYWCAKHAPENAINIKQIKVKNVELSKVMRIAFEKLDSLQEYFKNVKKIRIELQPGKLNPRMKTFSNAIYAYFIYKYQVTTNILKDIKFSNAKNKTLVCERFGLNIVCKKTRKYDRTKEMAVLAIKELLQEYTPEIFINSKKKDDLADSFLHTIFAIK